MFRASAFLQAVVDERGQRIFHVRLEDVGIQGVVDGQLIGVVDSGQGEDRDLPGLVRDDGLELVEDHLASVKLEAAVQDGVGDLSGVSELGRKTADFAADSEDVLGEQPVITSFLSTSATFKSYGAIAKS